jgi:flagellar biosynthetic protein FliR
MITLTTAELQTWIAALLWPMTRILGLVASAPLFGNNSVPIPVKIGLGMTLTTIIAPAIPALPAADPMSLVGLLIVAQQLLIGLAMGFAIRVVFAAVEIGGEIIGLTMGLSFATFFNPQTKGRSSSISQFLALISTMGFLAIDGHLVLLSILVDSFTTLPISATPIHGAGFYQIATFGEKIFSAGVQLALPVIAALLLTNLALSILTRAAPQLNLFGIGFPLTLGVGLTMIYLTLPFMAKPFERIFLDGFEKAREIPLALGGTAPPPISAPTSAPPPAPVPKPNTR